MGLATHERGYNVVETFKALPDWAKLVLAILATSALWIGYGEMHATSEFSTKRLDGIEIKLNLLGDRIGLLSDKVTAAATENLLMNTRQEDQILSLDRRLADVERGREASREIIATNTGKLLAIEVRLTETERSIRELRAHRTDVPFSP